LIFAIASITSRVNNFGTVLTPMIAVGLIALTASMKVEIGSLVKSEKLLKFRKIGARAYNEPIDVEQRIASPCLSNFHSLERHRLSDELRNAGPSRTAAKKEKALIRDLLSRNAHRGEDASKRHGGGALDVIVISTSFVPISGEDRDGIDVCKILPLDAALGVEFLHSVHELIHEGQVLLAADPGLPQAEIKRVFEQIVVIGADVQRDRKAVLRRLTRGLLLGNFAIAVSSMFRV
jgi:hypothetical protein